MSESFEETSLATVVGAACTDRGCLDRTGCGICRPGCSPVHLMPWAVTRGASPTISPISRSGPTPASGLISRGSRGRRRWAWMPALGRPRQRRDQRGDRSAMASGGRRAKIVARLHASQARFSELLGAMTDDDLARPYSHFQPDDPPYNPEPVIGWIVGNTFGHVDEHLPKIGSCASG